MIQYAHTAGHRTYRWDDTYFIVSVHKRAVIIHTNYLFLINKVYLEFGKEPKIVYKPAYTINLYTGNTTNWVIEYTPVFLKYLDKYSEKVVLSEL